MFSLSLRREEHNPIEIDGYNIHFISFEFDGNSFTGANAVWEEFMSVTFRTNDPASKRIEIKK